MRKSLKQRVIELIAEEYGISKSSLNETTSFKELRLDSMDMMDLLVEIESEFHIEISDEKAQHLRTIGELVKALRECGVSE